MSIYFISIYFIRHNSYLNIFHHISPTSMTWCIPISSISFNLGWQASSMGEVVRLLADANAFLTKKIEVGVLVMGWATGRVEIIGWKKLRFTILLLWFTLWFSMVYYGLLTKHGFRAVVPSVINLSHLKPIQYPYISIYTIQPTRSNTNAMRLLVNHPKWDSKMKEI